MLLVLLPVYSHRNLGAPSPFVRRKWSLADREIRLQEVPQALLFGL